MLNILLFFLGVGSARGAECTNGNVRVYAIGDMAYGANSATDCVDLCQMEMAIQWMEGFAKGSCMEQEGNYMFTEMKQVQPAGSPMPMDVDVYKNSEGSGGGPPEGDGATCLLNDDQCNEGLSCSIDPTKEFPNGVCRVDRDDSNDNDIAQGISIPSEYRLVLNSYLGRWHEIAVSKKFRDQYSAGVCTTADYSINYDAERPELNVINSNWDPTTMKPDVAKGRARQQGNGALEVAFFADFFAPYDVIHLEGDPVHGYQTAIVWSKEGPDLFFLSRDPMLSDEKYDELIAISEGLGVDTAALELERTPQYCYFCEEGKRMFHKKDMALPADAFPMGPADASLNGMKCEQSCLTEADDTFTDEGSCASVGYTVPPPASSLEAKPTKFEYGLQPTLTVKELAEWVGRDALLKAVSDVGLMDVLEDGKQKAVIAPSDDAFAMFDKLEPVRTVKEILEYHIIHDETSPIHNLKNVHGLGFGLFETRLGPDVYLHGPFNTDTSVPAQAIQAGCTMPPALTTVTYYGTDGIAILVDAILQPPRTFEETLTRMSMPMLPQDIMEAIADANAPFVYFAKPVHHENGAGMMRNDLGDHEHEILQYNIGILPDKMNGLFGLMPPGSYQYLPTLLEGNEYQRMYAAKSKGGWNGSIHGPSANYWLQYGEAHVKHSDIRFDNGVIHIIDYADVVLPHDDLRPIGEGDESDPRYKALPPGYLHSEVHTTGITGFQPEGILYHPRHRFFLLSSLSTGKVYKIDPISGEASVFSTAPMDKPATTGLAYDELTGVSWGCFSTASWGGPVDPNIPMGVFRLDTGAMVNLAGAHPHPAGHFINDVSAHGGRLAVTNSNGQFFLVDANEMTSVEVKHELWMNGPNGAVISKTLSWAISGMMEEGMLVRVDIDENDFAKSMVSEIELHIPDDLGLTMTGSDGLLLVHENTLVAVGRFEEADSTPATYIARFQSWDGWQTAHMTGHFKPSSTQSSTTVTEAEGQVYVVTTQFFPAFPQPESYLVYRADFVEVDVEMPCEGHCGEGTTCAGGKCVNDCEAVHDCCGPVDDGCSDEWVVSCVVVIDPFCKNTWDSQCAQEARERCEITC